jgi:hypothetical protein
LDIRVPNLGGGSMRNEGLIGCGKQQKVIRAGEGGVVHGLSSTEKNGVSGEVTASSESR